MKNKDSRLNKDFRIPQIPKIKGIRKAKTYQRDGFVSPIFGSDVKDDVTVPIKLHIIGDKIKRYDAFRIKPKLDKEKEKELYGRNYHEFDSIVNKETREQTFGVKTYKDKVETKQDTKDQVVEQDTKPNEETKELDGISQPSWLRKIHVEKPIEDQMTIETHNRPSNKVRTSAGFDTMNDNPVDDTFSNKDNDSDSNTYQVDSNYDSIHKKYQLPNVSMYKRSKRDPEEKPQWLLDQIDVINRTLKDHAVEGYVSGSKKGPTVTRYEISLEPGVNVKRVLSISDTLMMNLAAQSIRIEAPIPGKPYVGVEVPNAKAEIVSFGNVVSTDEFLLDHDHPLKVALGEDIDGKIIYVDIANMPHGLVAGATNSGKSVCINTILISLLIKNTPTDLRLILIDPKMVELTPYDGIPHLITPVITDAKMASTALQWAVDEMERRYRLFASTRTRNMKSFNESVKKGFISEEKMPYIVIVIDELGDLMMIAPHEVEDSIQRLTQKARAAGIHLIVATQRPTTDVIKGTIKSNIPTRIAFKVASFIDSTTIIDGQGAESLLGRGDMLLKEGEKCHRIQGAFISNDEIDETIDLIKSQLPPNYEIRHDELKRRNNELSDEPDDDLLKDVAYFVVEENSASINLISKKFEIGFNRAQKIINQLESKGIVGPSLGTKSRDVLVRINQLESIFED